MSRDHRIGQTETVNIYRFPAATVVEAAAVMAKAAAATAVAAAVAAVVAVAAAAVTAIAVAAAVAVMTAMVAVAVAAVAAALPAGGQLACRGSPGKGGLLYPSCLSSIFLHAVVLSAKVQAQYAKRTIMRVRHSGSLQRPGVTM
ncbi:hypothetical protein Vretimale_15288 [Volvox reticuliferus]|uniref:Uncharacterized protein n=1 Tax=Volvox reticuliferus TaxID=1737510 RepID=A0A8J4LUW3_9CHLO|nr:hypothetical protein Vretifemale_5489 [Volvox reticuliferus]GIM11831.1 hypothetical protein Vretimale_15288 [Volvox reticuliferus]